MLENSAKIADYPMSTLERLKSVFRQEFGRDFLKLPNTNNTAVVIVQHGYNTVKPLMDAILALGINKNNIFITTKPHTTPPSMLEYFQTTFGHNYVPFQWNPTQDDLAELSEDELKQQSLYRRLTAVTHRKLFRKFCDQLLCYPQSAEIENIIVCDEGGIFLNAFMENYSNPDPRYQRRLNSFRVVAIEHTKSGTYAKRLGQAGIPLINMAESDVKARFESEFIAESMFERLRLFLDCAIAGPSPESAEDSSNVTVGIVGLGNLGRELLGFLKRHYPSLTILLYDTDGRLYTASDISRQCLSNVFRETSIKQLFEGANLILGCTGQDITKNLPEDFFEGMTSGEKEFISCSSGDREFLTLLTSMPEYQFKGFEDIRDYTRSLSNGLKLIVRNGGFPINFLASANKSVSAEKIQITRGLKLAALVQALKLLELMPYLSPEQAAVLARPIKLDARYQWEVLQAFASDLLSAEALTQDQRSAVELKYLSITLETISERSVGVAQPSLEEALRLPQPYALERPTLAEELKLYVPPFSCDENGDPNDPIAAGNPLLEDTLVEFSKSDQKVLLLKSESGGGKTLAGCALELRAREGKLDLPRDTFFIFISLPSLKNPIDNLIGEYFQRKFGDQAHRKIDQFKAYNLCFILDAYDEVELFQKDITQVKNLYVTNRLYEWPNAKFIISCRSSFLNQMSEKLDEGSYKVYFAPIEMDQSRYDLLKVAQVVLFNSNQIDEYIDQYTQFNEAEWSSETYKRHIDELPGVVDLIKSPLLLKMTVDALPTILAWHKASLAIREECLEITERDVFLAYLKINLLRQQAKFIQFSGQPPRGFLANHLEFLLNLCQEMEGRRLFRVDYYFEPASLEGDFTNDGPAWATEFFGDPYNGAKPKTLAYLEMIRHNLTCFLKYERRAWGFLHDSYRGRFNSINGIELGNIKGLLRLRGTSEDRIRKESIKIFSKILFDRSAGMYYLSDYDIRRAFEEVFGATPLAGNLSWNRDEVAKKLRVSSGTPSDICDESYLMHVRLGVASGLHFSASSNGNTALHWLLQKFEENPETQEEKLIAFLKEIKRTGSHAAEVLNNKGAQKKTVFEMFEGKKPRLSEEVHHLFQEIELLLNGTPAFGMRN